MGRQADNLAGQFLPSSRRFLITQKELSLDQHVPTAFLFHDQPTLFEKMPKRAFSDHFHIQMAAAQ